MNKTEEDREDLGRYRGHTRSLVKRDMGTRSFTKRREYEPRHGNVETKFPATLLDLTE
jgi:hypothetical protein